MSRFPPGSALIVLLSAGCALNFGTDPVQPPDGWTDVLDHAGETGDVVVEDGPDAEDVIEDDEVSPGCDPGGSDDFCDGSTLMRCNTDGTAYVSVSCSPGVCIEETHAHCMDMDVHNVDDDSLLCAGTSGLGPDEVPDNRTWVVYFTDTGEIRAYNEDFSENTQIRGSGDGDVGGIVYTQQDQPDGAPPLGILSLSSLTVPPGVGFAAIGTRAAVLLVCGPVLVEGLAGSFALPADTITGLPVPGAAGGIGGLPAVNPDGGGTGGGGVGGIAFTYRGGGGGGGHGAAGGSGGGLGTATGGAGGGSYGAADLVPLTAGSGGGSGADPYDASCSSEGGSGGGAMLIASTVSIDVAASGSIEMGGAAGTGGMGCSSGGAGGAGGGSGGGLLLESPTVTVLGYLLAAGGGGGAGSPGTGEPGARGLEGIAAVGTATGGEGAGLGTSGGSGGNPSTGGGQNGQNGTLGVAIFMGGGGGGDGIIRINALAVDVTEARLHPLSGSGLFSTGDLALF
ncbi:MAG: hypothetical protein JRG91_02430 [Deltaproteobacteria bacterium]|nr:hypothetical protein [Deltaproteobacteria bacterium]